MGWPENKISFFPSHFKIQSRKKTLFCFSLSLSLFFVLVVANEIAGVNPEKALSPASSWPTSSSMNASRRRIRATNQTKAKKVISCLCFDVTSVDSA